MGFPPSSSPHLPTESHVQRYKFVWRLLLISNFALGAYIFLASARKKMTEETKVAAKASPRPSAFARVRKKDTSTEENKAAAEAPSPPVATATTLAPEEFVLSPPIVEPVKVRQPIPEDQQCELFKWILEEKRKVKPKDPDEKKRIDEEKAILKQFIRSKSIPSL